VSARLGQHFLADRNVLDVIERLAEVTGEDVVLEVGGGLGALSERLAAEAGSLHVVEIDARLAGELETALRQFDRAQLHLADATELDLSALKPAPTKVVANLPYGVAATVILRTVEQLPSVRSWVVMVQREVGERFAAAPGRPAYGVPSVLAQLACEVRVLRAVSRSVFRPVPNVDSVLLGLERRGPAAGARLAGLVRASFAHRRKPLAGSLALAPGAEPAIRERARAALERLGLRADARAERLSPEQFRELEGLLWP
jgi:16S rRNA (adenine1518-N6/adenine1519-N6)-dimethyltransferase